MASGGGGESGRTESAVPPGRAKSSACTVSARMQGLDEVPFEGHPLGQKIYENVSKEAWKMWVDRMKMIMNEYRLNLARRKPRSS